MWSSPPNPYHLHAPTASVTVSPSSASSTTLLLDRDHNPQRKKKSSASAGESVSLLMANPPSSDGGRAIDVETRFRKFSDKLMRSGRGSGGGRMSPAAASLIAAASLANDPIGMVAMSEKKWSGGEKSLGGNASLTDGNNNMASGGGEDDEDPWALDKLLNDDQDLSEPMPTWKKYARMILPHVGLILLSFLYVVGGAFVFYHVERPNEVAIRAESLRLIDAENQAMLRHLWTVVSDNTTTREEAERIALAHVDNVSRLLFDAFDTHYITISHLRNSRQYYRGFVDTESLYSTLFDGRDPTLSSSSTVDYSWTFTTSIFFTTTLLTTIGYGNLVPVTATGRMFCIFYALFGVPLILITVADIGKFLSERIIWLYGVYAQAKKRLVDELRRRQRRRRRRAAIAARQRRTATASAVLVAAATIGKGSVANGLRTCDGGEPEEAEEETTVREDEENDASTSLVADRGKSHRKRATKNGLTIPEDKVVDVEEEDDDDDEDGDDDDEENEENEIAARRKALNAQLQELGIDNYISIPIALIAAILLGYMTIGAVLLAKWENWRFFEGFYFSFITMTTVGFGDIVPIRQHFFIVDLFYIIIGLAITTMCIDLVGIEYIEKIHYFGRAIGARFALVNVGGKMVRVPDLVRCAYVLHQKYGLRKKGSGGSGTSALIVKGAYAPKDLALIRFIDYSALASFESMSSLLTNLFGLNASAAAAAATTVTSVSISQESREPSIV